MARSYPLGLVCIALLASAASATQFRVGGASGWSVPDACDEPYNAWASRMRFHIGDQLLFVYPKETDSVLIVADPSAYDACNTAAATNKFDDGNTVFTFDRSGPFFFISGNETNCRAGEKLVVVVMADCSPPPALSPPPPAMPPQSAAPMPSPPSSPPSRLPPSAAPVPSPMSPPSMPPLSGAPTSLPPSMPPPSGAPTSSPPSEAPAMPAPSASPGSAPSPTGSAPGSAPTTTPVSPPSPPGSPPSAPGTPATPGTPGGALQPPSGSGNTPGTPDTTAPPGNGAAPVAAGLVSTLAACVGYAILAI